MKKYYFSVIILAVLVSFSVITGCQDSVNTMKSMPQNMTIDPVYSGKIITDDILAGRVHLVSLNKEKLPNGLMKVQAAFRNERTGFFYWLWYGDAPYHIAYRFTWFNQSGMKVDTAASTWIPIDIMPGDVVYISGTAPNASCKDFTITLKQID
jgi:uncharacterized protein YcfL